MGYGSTVGVESCIVVALCVKFICLSATTHCYDAALICCTRLPLSWGLAFYHTALPLLDGSIYVINGSFVLLRCHSHNALLLSCCFATVMGLYSGSVMPCYRLYQEVP